MYGGADFSSSSTRFFEEVWVLSIPSFLWIAVNDTNNRGRDAGGQSDGPMGHTCTIWQEDRMIVVGGFYPRSLATIYQNGNDINICDPTHSPIRLLDTSTYSWQTQFISNTTDYRVPPVVYHVIGGE